MRKLVMGAVLVVAAGCHLSETGRIQTTSLAGAEALAGTRAAPRLERRFGGVLRDVDAQRRMVRVSERLVANTPELSGDYRFTLLASPDTNAFSLPGGRIYVTQGLLDLLDDDLLLAATLAHEMAHLAAKDGLKPRCSHPDEALKREISADLSAAQYMENAGYHGEDLARLVLRLKEKQPRGWAETRSRRLLAAPGLEK